MNVFNNRFEIIMNITSCQKNAVVNFSKSRATRRLFFGICFLSRLPSVILIWELQNTLKPFFAERKEAFSLGFVFWKLSRLPSVILVWGLQNTLKPFIAKRKKRLFLWNLFFVKIAVGDPGLGFTIKLKLFLDFGFSQDYLRWSWFGSYNKTKAFFAPQKT